MTLPRLCVPDPVAELAPASPVRLLIHRAALAVGLALAAAGAFAQSGSADGYKPQSGQPGKDVVWVPTPDAVVERMLLMAEVKPSDRVVDLGSGDGKIAITAARKHGARATGLEYNPDMVRLSQRRVREAGVSDQVEIQQADIFVTDFSRATVVTMYLLPQLNLRLRPKLFEMPPGTRVVSHSFDMGDWVPDEVSRAGSGHVYFWRIPANVSGTWRFQAPTGKDMPQSISFSQKYQQVQGDARFGDALTAGAVDPRLSGDAITFALRDPSGQVQRFTGKVNGDRITGTMATGQAASVPFEATRSEPGAPIVSQVPTAQDERSAQVNLGSTD